MHHWQHHKRLHNQQQHPQYSGMVVRGGLAVQGQQHQPNKHGSSSSCGNDSCHSVLLCQFSVWKEHFKDAPSPCVGLIKMAKRFRLEYIHEVSMYVLKYPHWSKKRFEPVFVDLLRSPGINSQHSGPVRQPYWLYRPARLHRLAVPIPRNWFLVSINVYKYGLQNFKNIYRRLFFYCSFCLKYRFFKSTSGSICILYYKPAVAGISMYRWFPVNWAPHTHICLPDFQATAM